MSENRERTSQSILKDFLKSGVIRHDVLEPELVNRAEHACGGLKFFFVDGSHELADQISL